MMENKCRYLEMIQGVINRMAANSFSLKGWAVTLVAGILVLADKDTDRWYFLIAYIPIIVFWGLDAYYLLLERRYRALYDKARMMNDEHIDFSMNVNQAGISTNQNGFWKSFFSKTELAFYFPLAVISAGVMVITYFI